MPHLRKRLPALRHLLMKPSLRTGRIANFSSSMPPLIGGLRRPIGFHVQHRHLWCRRERSYGWTSSSLLARVQDIEIGNTVNPTDDSFAIKELICSTPRATRKVFQTSQT